MKIAAIVEALVEAGATPQMILAAVKSAEEQKDAASDASRDKARARVAKWRANKVGNVTERSVTSRNGLRAHSETKPIDTDNSKKQTHSADVEAFKAAFAGVCDPGRVEAIIKHRRTKRGQITGHAANLFIADAKAAGLSVPDAVDTCISRNWITVKADWLAPNQRGSPPPGKPRSVLDAINALNTRMEQADAISSEAIEGTGATVFRLSAAQQR